MLTLNPALLIVHVSHLLFYIIGPFVSPIHCKHLLIMLTSPNDIQEICWINKLYRCDCFQTALNLPKGK